MTLISAPHTVSAADLGSVLWSKNLGDDILSSPAMDYNGTIYVGAGNNGANKFFAISPAGQIKWQKDPGVAVYSTPAVDQNGTVYITTGGGDPNVFAYSPAGTVKWSKNIGAGGAIQASPSVSRNGTLYIGAAAGDLYALSIANGAVKWTKSYGQAIIGAAAIDDNGTVYIGHGGGTFYAYSPTGTLKWSKSGGAIQQSASIDANGTIYVGSSGGKFYAYSPAGTLKWTKDIQCSALSSSSINDNGTIYAGSSDGKVYAISPAGTILHTLTGLGNIYGTPTIDANGTLYVGTDDHKLYALSPALTVKWSKDLNDEIYGSPVVNANGTVFVGSYDNSFYAIQGYKAGGLMQWAPWPKFKGDNLGLGHAPWPVYSTDTSQDVQVTVAETEDVDNATLQSDYNFSVKTYSDKFTYEAKLGAELSGCLASFGYHFKGMGKKVSELGLYKLLPADNSYKSFGAYQTTRTCTADGGWWVATELSGDPLTQDTVLEAGENYYACFCVKDNGSYDLDDDLCEILDPVVLGSSSGSGSSSSSGCSLNPASDFSVEWLLLLAAPVLVWLRFRRSGRS